MTQGWRMMGLLERFRAWLDGLTEAGRRHSMADEQMIQAIHDHAVNLGASCPPPDRSAQSASSSESAGAAAAAAGSGEGERLIERDFTQEERDRLARSGAAMPDGSFPIVTIEDLRNAIRAFGRAKDKEAVRRHIIKRARALGALDELPEDWRVSEAAAQAPSQAPRAPAPDALAVSEAFGGISSGRGSARGATPAENAGDGFGGSPTGANGAHEAGGAGAGGGAGGAPEELTGDLVPLVERAVRPDGTLRLRIIAPGQGTSGYYPTEVLKRDGPRVFRSGLHMFLDHPTPAEEADRPERSLRDLAGVLVSDARWEDQGPAGPGLYAEAKIRSDLAPLIEELAPYIGVSIRALGRAAPREVDGRPVRVIEAIERAHSVDFVTQPGAGGRVLQLLEAARQARRPGPVGGWVPEQREQLEEEEAMEALEEARRQLEEQQRELARLREALLLREARDVVIETLARLDLPEPTRQRLVETLSAAPPVVNGELDRAALIERVHEAATAELEYLTRVTGSRLGGVFGMGSQAGAAPSVDDATKRLQESFRRILGDENLAALAAAGRTGSTGRN